MVKQIVGSTLRDDTNQDLITNFTSTKPASWFAGKYREDKLDGGHVVLLGTGNQEAAKDALAAWPGGLQLGGGVTNENALEWLEAGAGSLIVTSHVFQNGEIHHDRLRALADLVGRSRLVLDISCRKKDGKYWIVTDRWQKFTNVEITPTNLDYFSGYCSELLVHAVDVEGKGNGIEGNLIRILGKWNKIPITYAGGIHSWKDIEMIALLGKGNLDFTVGSALDIFGGHGLKYADLAYRNKPGFETMDYESLTR